MIAEEQIAACLSDMAEDLAKGTQAEVEASKSLATLTGELESIRAAQERTESAVVTLSDEVREVLSLFRNYVRETQRVVTENERLRSEVRKKLGT